MRILFMTHYTMLPMWEQDLTIDIIGNKQYGKKKDTKDTFRGDSKAYNKKSNAFSTFKNTQLTFMQLKLS